MKVKDVIKVLNKFGLGYMVNCNDEKGRMVWGDEIDECEVIGITLHIKGGNDGNE